MKPELPIRVVVLSMNTPAAALILEPLFEDERFSVELVVLSRSLGGRMPLGLLAHLTRVSGPRYVLWQVRRKLPAVLREALGRLGRRPRSGTAASLRQVLARRPEIPIVQVASLHARGAFARVRRAHPDLVLCAIFPEKLTREQLELPPLGTLNVHGSLLPRLRGVTPVLHALADGADEHGATVHRVDEGLDTGPILARAICSFRDVQDYQTAWRRTMEASAVALCEALDRLARGRAEYVAQGERGASYCSFPTRGTLSCVRARGIRLN